jgi:hypothetical protein
MMETNEFSTDRAYSFTTLADVEDRVASIGR